VVLKMDRRMIPEEDPAQVEADVRRMLENAVDGLPGIRIEVRRLLLARSLRPLPGQEKLVDSLRRNAGEVLGEAITVLGSQL
jgi:acetylornithine deacetylase/succinyl-diaminopimelate desuccinylase-like protein